MTAEETERLALELAIRENPDVWFESFAKIRTVTGESERVASNILQERIVAPYKAAERENRPCREIGLKPRKKGYSTMVAGMCHTQLSNYSHEGVIVGNKLETSETVYRMVQHFAETDEFPGWPRPDENLTTMMRWPHGSLLNLRTAQGKGTARGMTPHFVHGTEVAHWERAKEALLALMNAVPDHGFNAVFLESTPNGAQGEFYEIWKNARWPTKDECPNGELYWRKWDKLAPDPEERAKGAGKLDFVRVFAAWYEFAEARVALDEEGREEIRRTLDAEEWHRGEQALIDDYQVDEEQLAWRRMTIKTKCGRSPDKFDQEYPKDPESCFLAAGSPVFDIDGLKGLECMPGGAISRT